MKMSLEWAEQWVDEIGLVAKYIAPDADCLGWTRLFYPFSHIFE
jgi:hypothetical protein